MKDKGILLPKCVGFIMDGNRRWAKEQGLESFSGHEAGKDAFYHSVEWVREAGINHAVYYAFSTENWKRKPEEISYLMELFKLFIQKILNDIDELKVGVRIIGRRNDFSAELQSLVEELENKSNPHLGTTIWIALSYGGRSEIIEAVNKAITKGEIVTEEDFSKLLWSNGMPDPDLIIRTGGEQRLSNFLPWQSVYSELFFTNTYWPAFTKVEFERILIDYATRERRIGK